MWKSNQIEWKHRCQTNDTIYRRKEIEERKKKLHFQPKETWNERKSNKKIIIKQKKSWTSELTNESEVEYNLNGKLEETKTWHGPSASSNISDNSNIILTPVKMMSITAKMQYQHPNHLKSISQQRFVVVLLTLIGLFHGVHCEIGN